MERQTFTCAYCEKNFTLKRNLQRHISKQHLLKQENPFKRLRLKFKEACPLCRITTPDILSHFSTDHKIDVKSGAFEFQDESSFKNWKNVVEYGTFSRFVISKSRKEKKRRCNMLTFKFTCHRSGTFKSRGRNVRYTTSYKIGGCCPSGMYVTVDKRTKKHYVIYIETHVGHPWNDRIGLLGDNTDNNNDTDQQNNPQIAAAVCNDVGDKQPAYENDSSSANPAEEIRNHNASHSVEGHRIQFSINNNIDRENDPEITAEEMRNRNIGEEQIVSEDIETASLFCNVELEEDVAALRKDCDDILARITTKAEVDIFRHLLETVKKQLRDRRASNNDNHPALVG